MPSGTNGIWQKITLALLGVLVTISLAWTKSKSDDDKKQDDRHDATEENIRTIHYESQIQRQLLESIADAVDADTGPVPPVRPLRQVER